MTIWRVGFLAWDRPAVDLVVTVGLDDREGLFLDGLNSIRTAYLIQTNDNGCHASTLAWPTRSAHHTTCGTLSWSADEGTEPCFFLSKCRKWQTTTTTHCWAQPTKHHHKWSRNALVQIAPRAGNRHSCARAITESMRFYRDRFIADWKLNPNSPNGDRKEVVQFLHALGHFTFQPNQR